MKKEFGNHFLTIIVGEIEEQWTNNEIYDVSFDFEII